MKIALGMSGGVDSSLCAHLLKEQGHEVTGVYLECWRAPGCRSDEDRADALKVALSLGLPFEVLDFKDAYRDKVVEYFFAEYEAGRTPNPDVLCNKEIKFGMFYDWAMHNGFDAIATGHYAQTNEVGELIIPADKHKDQTYFLYLLTSAQLKHVIFPLAELTKEQVRTFADERGIHVARKADSVGICFIGDINVHAFLKERLGEHPGEVVDTKGTVIGRHTGLWFYTIGQRHGFEIDKKSAFTSADGQIEERENFPPFYVIRKDALRNQLIVGFGAETFQKEFSIRDLHWLAGVAPASLEHLVVRIRHTGALLPCSVTIDGSTAHISLNKPTQGIAEGQSAVLYQKNATGNMLCLGGGPIDWADAPLDAGAIVPL
ncbi:tRNA 2-thiouridine(34) synthase MnmA [Candidatus Woesebacteria bacterium]|nr:tRNA 2-thiouridine(34) synthase MnmA [Candidatus Woesebacteria bacterium]